MEIYNLTPNWHTCLKRQSQFLTQIFSNPMISFLKIIIIQHFLLLRGFPGFGMDAHERWEMSPWFSSAKTTHKTFSLISRLPYCNTTVTFLLWYTQVFSIDPVLVSFSMDGKKAWYLQLKGGVVCFGSCFQKFQSVVSCPWATSHSRRKLLTCGMWGKRERGESSGEERQGPDTSTNVLCSSLRCLSPSQADDQN